MILYTLLTNSVTVKFRDSLEMTISSGSVTKKAFSVCTSVQM